MYNIAKQMQSTASKSSPKWHPVSQSNASAAEAFVFAVGATACQVGAPSQLSSTAKKAIAWLCVVTLRKNASHHLKREIE